MKECVPADLLAEGIPEYVCILVLLGEPRPGSPRVGSREGIVMHTPYRGVALLMAHVLLVLPPQDIKQCQIVLSTRVVLPSSYKLLDAKERLDKTRVGRWPRWGVTYMHLKLFLDGSPKNNPRFHPREIGHSWFSQLNNA